jgi:hypothetical protein
VPVNSKSRENDEVPASLAHSVNDNTDDYFLLVSKMLLDCVFFTDKRQLQFSFEYHNLHISVLVALAMSSTRKFLNIVEFYTAA